MGRCIAINEARRRYLRLSRVTPGAPANRSGTRIVPNPAAVPPGNHAIAPKSRHWMLRVWTWLLTPGG
jgi:hypothetical protein